tara:strand:- start:1464 stop:2468 length:1005 start_codon:yes stop_codon:yes gene_type:complete
MGYMRTGLPFKIRAPLQRLKPNDNKEEYNIFTRTLYSNIYKYLKKTPLHQSRVLGDNVFLKREDLQPTFSFYIRGVLNQLLNEDIKKPLITSSVGSRGLCLSYASSLLKKESVIFMPQNTPKERVEMVNFFDSKIFLHGETTNSCQKMMEEYAHANDMTIVGTHSNEDVIAGCGTIALEILREKKDVDAIFVPVGGGSLISGICYNVKAMFPNVKVYGVEYEKQNILYDSLMSGYLKEHPDPGLFGISVSKIDQSTFDICNEYLDDIVLVNKRDIESSIIDCFKDTRTVIEPHGILSVSGLKKTKLEKKNIVCIISDAGNVNCFDHVSSLYELV